MQSSCHLDESAFSSATQNIHRDVKNQKFACSGRSKYFKKGIDFPKMVGGGSNHLHRGITQKVAYISTVERSNMVVTRGTGTARCT